MNQTDRELLELAAKAAGIRVEYTEPSLFTGQVFQLFFDGEHQVGWNPLDDDGDALRLAVKLRLSVDTDYNNGAAAGSAYLSMDCFHEYDPPLRFGADRNAATRRAVVRAAAEIAKAGGGV